MIQIIHSADSYIVTPVKPLAPFWFQCSLFIVCIIGICGNLLNLFVLTHQRLLAALSPVEQSSNRLLIALATADLLFCSVVLPAVFFTDESYMQPANKMYILYYKVMNIISKSTIIIHIVNKQDYFVLYKLK